MTTSAPPAMDRPPLLSADYLERLFEGAGLAIFSVDSFGRIQAWNRLGQDLFTRAGGGASRDLRHVLPELDRPAFDQALRDLRKSLEPVEFRTRIAGEGGVNTEYAVWLTPMIEADGSVQHVSVWFHDITSRLQLRRGLRKQERLTALGSLSGAVAHHYSNLICSIATSLEFALNMNTMTAMRRALQRTAEAAGRAASLTRQLLAFAQADHCAGDQADLTEVVLYFCDEHEARLAERGVRLLAEWEARSMRPVPRDPMMIVLGNLVTNSAEALAKGGTVSVSLRERDDGSFLLVIADDGPGIAAELHERVFEPFFTTKGVLAEGPSRQAGMGLAVAHGLVHEMGGQISIAKNTGGGARFEIVFPPEAAPQPMPCGENV